MVAATEEKTAGLFSLLTLAAFANPFEKYKCTFSGEANLEVVNLCPFSGADLTKLYHGVRFDGF